MDNIWSFIGFGVIFIALLSAVYIIFIKYSAENTQDDKDSTEAVSDNRTYFLVSPLCGELIPLSSVNDEVFSQKILGDGVAIIPDNGLLYAPANAKIYDVFDTKHAISLQCDNGAELLIHVGLDTVNLEGRPFHPKVNAGDHVKAGQLIMEFDIDDIKSQGYDTVTPIIISNHDDFILDMTEPQKIANGAKIITLTRKS